MSFKGLTWVTLDNKRECVKEILHTERNWRTIIKKVNEDLFWNAFSSTNCALERCCVFT